jgi:hypothetical protein
MFIHFNLGTFIASSECALFIIWLYAAAPTHAPPDAPPEPVRVALTLADGGTLNGTLLEKDLEFVTKYGTLRIPVADLSAVDFALRTPPARAQAIASAITRLGGDDSADRDAAEAELVKYGRRAWGPLERAVKSQDPEVARRAASALTASRVNVPREDRTVPQRDALRTTDALFTGRLTAEYVTIETEAFGVQKVPLSALKGIAVVAPAAPPAAAADAPGNLVAYAQQFGKELTFKVTGQGPAGGATPTVWGTDVYTLDSSLAVAAVHAGKVAANQTAVLRVRIVASPPGYVSTHRYGVTSLNYTTVYPAGAYVFVK